MIEARSAADLAGATLMDRPEGIAISPVTGAVFVTLSGNKKLKPGEINAANPREKNIWGHIIELVPQEGDHTAEVFDREMLVLCGSPKDPNVAAAWNAMTTGHG